jgi:hypothetical protein
MKQDHWGFGVTGSVSLRMAPRLSGLNQIVAVALDSGYVTTNDVQMAKPGMQHMAQGASHLPGRVKFYHFFPLSYGFFWLDGADVCPHE